MSPAARVTPAAEFGPARLVEVEVTGMRGMSARSYELRLLGSIDELVNWLPAHHSQRTGIEITSEGLALATRAADRWDAGALPVENT